MAKSVKKAKVIKFNKKLPKFKSHKIITALAIASVVREMNGTAKISFVPESEKSLQYESVIVNNTFITKHNPKAGQVYVTYKDGYVSVSPKDAFEDGYSPVGKDDEAKADALDEKIKELKEKEVELQDREKAVSEKETELAKDIDVEE